MKPHTATCNYKLHDKDILLYIHILPLVTFKLKCERIHLEKNLILMPSMIAKDILSIKKQVFEHIYLTKLTFSNLNLVKILSKLKNNTSFYYDTFSNKKE